MKETQRKEQKQPNMFIHLVAGGLAGTTGAILTSPLEVVKTRFQSSKSNIYSKNGKHPGLSTTTSNTTTTSSSSTCANPPNHHKNSIKSYSQLNTSSHFLRSFSVINAEKKTQMMHTQIGRGGGGERSLGTTIYHNMKFIIQNEGPRALFKGLGPTIMGVAPYRAIYFFSYANSKDFFRKYTPTEDMCHVCSAGIAGVTAVSLTNPIWFVKTRLQLNETRRGLKTLEVVQKILREKGVLGFYKGISASYFGVVETTMYFVLYEKLKTLQFNQQSNDGKDGLSIGTFFSSAAFAKTLASCLCYPHEVARTRLREEGTKYNSFFQTLNLVIKEEGIRGIYKGMATHLIRQIPNTAIVMTTYEIIVKYFLTRQTDSDDE